jgi:hypothetical protein
MRKKYNLELLIFITIVIYSIVIVIFNCYFRVKTIYFSLLNKKSIDDIYNNIQNSSFFTKKISTHIWNENIDSNIQESIQNINSEILSHLGDDMVYVPSMTELYYSSKENKNSDKQFTSIHMDGPFYTCKLYRALVSINGNKNIDTHFPNDKNKKHNLKKYDVILFDYNNTPHYIDVNNDKIDNSQRIILKLHYERLNSKLCQTINCKYGRQSRYVFESNKNKLFLSGIISSIGQYYNALRKYILIFILAILYYYYKTHNKIAKYILWLFVIIELIIILYTLHFNFIYKKECVL